MKKGYKVLLTLAICIVLIFTFYKVQKYRAELPMTKITQMLGKGTEVSSISTTGLYVTDDSGHLEFRNIYEITDKAKIEAIIKEIDKYNLEKYDTSKIENSNGVYKKGDLKSFTLNFKTSHSKYVSMNVVITCNMTSKITFFDVKRSKRISYNEAYSRFTENKDLFDSLFNSVMGKSE